MAHPTFVRGLYRFQQRIGLTAPEFRAVSLFIGFLVVGSAVEHFRDRVAPIDPAVYAGIDAYFEERAVAAGIPPRADSGSVAAEQPTMLPNPETTVSGVPPLAGPAPDPPPSATSDGPVDLNTAGAADLERLPGIGPALAARIVEFRTRNGPFLFAEDLLMVRGIGERTLERLIAQVTVDGVSPRAPAPDG